MALVGVGATKTEVEVKISFDIKDTTQKATVGDDCRTKLMYYLHCFGCISKFLTVHPEWRKYTEYQTCSSWTIEEEEELLHICKDEITLEVANAVGFIEAPRDLLGNSCNRFFEVTNTDEVLLNQIQVHIDENSIYAANRSVGAKREIKFSVMMYTKEWINTYYHTPLRDLSSMIERHKEDKRRGLHNEEIMNKNKNCCCIITDNENFRHPNVVRIVLILYFIHAITLLVLYLQSNKKYDKEPWLKWVHLVGFIISIVNSSFGFICLILVSISHFYHNWIVFVKLLIRYMMYVSVISIPISFYMNSCNIVAIIQMLMSITLTSFSCIIDIDKNKSSRCTCLCCGGIKIAPEKIDYYL